MLTVTIRRATAADRPEWQKMRQALWPDDLESLTWEDMDDLLADPLTPVFLAVRADGSLGGFLEAGTRRYAGGGSTSPVGYLEGWYVDPDLRRQGVGRALVSAAEDWARGIGLTEMASDTWLWNEASVQAHGQLGYEEQERLVHFLKKL